MLAFFFMCIYPCGLLSKKISWQNIILVFKFPPPAIPPNDQIPITPPPLLSSFAPSADGEVRRIILPCLPQTILVILTLFRPVFSNHVWMYTSNQSPLSSTCHCLRDTSLPPSSKLLWNICLKTQLTSRWTLQLSFHLKSEFRFKSSWAYHSCSYIIIFGVIPINHSLPICIPAVSFHWNCLSSYPKTTSSCNQEEQTWNSIWAAVWIQTRFFHWLCSYWTIR